MQVVGAAVERLALEPFLAAVGHAVVVGVGELPDARRRGDVERAVGPEDPLGEHHPVGEHGAAVVAAVAVEVHQPHDPVGALHELLLRRGVRAGGVGDIKPPLLVEVRLDRPVHQRRPGDPLDLEAVGERERAALHADLARPGGREIHAQRTVRIEQTSTRRKRDSLHGCGPRRTAFETRETRARRVVITLDPRPGTIRHGAWPANRAGP